MKFSFVCFSNKGSSDYSLSWSYQIRHMQEAAMLGRFTFTNDTHVFYSLSVFTRINSTSSQNLLVFYRVKQWSPE